ncbi:MAG: DUF2442 domain-containing protein [Actinobacteria bacterium]|nr:DUF2442 domain-containing protein [Actinomycetota bacterium]
MKKIIFLKVLMYRKLFLKFDDGTEGFFVIEDEFTNIAEPLNDPKVFSTAKIIDDGYGIGFEKCDYDICAQHAYAKTQQYENVDVI